MHIFLICQGKVRAIYEWSRLLLQLRTTDVTAAQCFVTESLIHQPAVPKICDHLVLLQWIVSVTQCAYTHTQCIATASAVTEGENQTRATLTPQRLSLWPLLWGFFKSQRSKRLPFWVHDLERDLGFYPLNLDWPLKTHLSWSLCTYQVHLVCSSAQLSQPVLTLACHETCCPCCALSRWH